jgi:hypothetical protein
MSPRKVAGRGVRPDRLRVHMGLCKRVCLQGCRGVPSRAKVGFDVLLHEKLHEKLWTSVV